MAISYDQPYCLHSESIKTMGDIISMRTDAAKIKIENLILNEERIECYYKYTDLIAKLIFELGIKDNSISYSALISALAKRGYFSENPIGKNCNLSEYNMFDFLGIDVVNGKCSCRHFAYFHKDVFDRLEQFSCIIPCTSSFRTKNLVFSEANHAINGIRYNNNMYGYDSYNMILFGINNGFEMEQIHPVKRSFVLYKPYMDMILSNISFEDTMNRVKAFESFSKLPKISLEELNEIVNETVEKARSQKDTLNDFKEESKKYIKKITK